MTGNAISEHWSYCKHVVENGTMVNFQIVPVPRLSVEMPPSSFASVLLHYLPALGWGSGVVVDCDASPALQTRPLQFKIDHDPQALSTI